MADETGKVRSLASVAGIVAAATLISKIFGLVRQQAIAAAFGVGVAVDAYNYAYVIPGFLLVLLGGINGPFHSAIVSVVAKRDKRDAVPLIETMTTLVGGILLLVTVALVIFAHPLIDLVAPGLSETAAGQEIREIAVIQFRIMAPMALLAGLIGIGFGSLNAADMYWLPSISPLFSSVALLGGLGVLALSFGKQIIEPQYAMLGGLVLAWGTLLGALLQWLVQVIVQWREGLGTLRLRFDFWRPGVREVLNVMGPATFSSGMMQINVYTDLWFASFIPQTASALGYAGLLVQTPLGIISNTLLVPLLPIFSRLAAPEHWDQLKQRIRQGLILSGLTMLPLGALMVALATPIVRVVYERYAFDREASEFVAAILMAYGLGMFVYLGRDVIVRVFYALGDGQTPFRVSIANIFLNVLLDYFFIQWFGAPGLVLATMGVNVVSMVVLLWLLNGKIGGLPWLEWATPIAALTVLSFVTGMAGWGIYVGLQRFLGDGGFLLSLFQLTVAGCGGLAVFAMVVARMGLSEVDLFMNRLRGKFGGRRG
ncbi:murein biosynthesis integral membrane protein MurJ [Geitlerinema sp. P-1104]|uniref:murein biosynthesis integral membrane protein MurJ n=1 Tax=Geitlerinema sp. P-1104 TaxID=2546230 RepID=UPI001476941E|nr:murein biosynthesis integral membrane protein MurJ [Geitlerinema sp. P-1104]NMG57554.1 murein biosynthesis integral membrane protein MurJ [Geitlerinema sp. P-1104]